MNDKTEKDSHTLTLPKSVDQHSAPIKVLTITTLYPNAAQPSHGIFVENRLRNLAETGEVLLRVVAPVPWFPWKSKCFGRYGTFAKAPSAEVRYGIPITHPRYFLIPKIGMTVAPVSLRATILRHVRSLIAAGSNFDLIDAHFFYPDGIAAAWLAQRLGLPVVITARGTDLNDYVSRYPAVGRAIRLTAERADGLIVVCNALKDVLVKLGIPPERVQVLRNGVDLQLFTPMARDTARAILGITRPTLLSVGHLIERKGHDIAIAALMTLPGFDLLIVGDGPDRSKLAALAHNLGMADRVRFLGHVSHADLPGIYSAADALILPSSREGWANVLLESMACGTPVVASAVWGTPEIVCTPAAGVLVHDRTSAGFATAIKQLFAKPPDRSATRAYAEMFSWESTSLGQIRVFRSAIANAQRRHDRRE